MGLRQNWKDSQAVWRVAWLGFVILSVVSLRLYLVNKYASTLLDSDEAISGLMARHILRGNIPVFFYGQYYFGTVEAFSLAAAFSLFGATPFVLKFTVVTWFCVFLVIEYWVARDVTSPFTARLTTILLSVSPAFLTVHSLKALGYMPTLCLCTFALLLTLQAARRGLSLQLAAALGFVLGFAWWTQFLTIVVGLPIAVFLLLRHRQQILGRSGVVLTAAFVVGSLPFWVVNVLRSWPSLSTRAENPATFEEGVYGFFSTAVPIFFGTHAEGRRYELMSWGSLVGIVLFAVALLGPALAFRRSRDAHPIVDGRFLLWLVLLLFPFVFAASGFGGVVIEPRYLIPLYGVAYILLLSPFPRLAQVVITAILLLIHLTGSLRVGADDIATALNAEPQQALIAYLREHHVRTVYAPYWVAYRLSFETEEEIISTPPKWGVRYSPYLTIAAHDPAPAYVDFNARRYEAGTLGVKIPSGYAKSQVGNFDVFLPIRRRKSENRHFH